MAAELPTDRFVTDPAPSKDDGSVTEYERNVERVRRETEQNPPAERVRRETKQNPPAERA